MQHYCLWNCFVVSVKGLAAAVVLNGGGEGVGSYEIF